LKNGDPVWFGCEVSKRFAGKQGIEDLEMWVLDCGFYSNSSNFRGNLRINFLRQSLRKALEIE
jgi:aminopeptidase C